MRTLALTGRSRQWLAQVHRWSGIFLLFFLFVAGVTGAVLAFRWEVDRAINPQLFSVEPQTASISYTTLMEGVEKRFPEVVVSTVILPKAKDDAAIVYVKSRMDAHVAHVHVMGMKSELDFNQVFVNPYTGAILGKRSTSRFALSKESFVPVVARLHFTLLLDELGAWVMGIAALVWFLTSFLGLVLTWPATWKSLRSWKPLVSMRTKSGNYKLNYDLHRMASFVTLPILVVVAFTSFYINLPAVVRPVVNAVSPLFDSKVIPVAARMDMDSPRISVEQAIAVARTAMPGGRSHSVGRDFIKGLYSVRMQLPSDVSPTGNNTVYVRMSDGEVAYQRRAQDATGGDVFSAWQFPLHTGSAFGLVGQILIFIGAVALVAMCVTGLNVWLRKRRGANLRVKAGLVQAPLREMEPVPARR